MESPAHGGLRVSPGPPNSASARVWGAAVQGRRERQGSTEEPTTRTRSGGAAAGLISQTRSGFAPGCTGSGRSRPGGGASDPAALLRPPRDSGDLREEGPVGRGWRKRKAGDGNRSAEMVCTGFQVFVRGKRGEKESEQGVRGPRSAP